MDRPTSQDLLVALSTRVDMSRAALCRLGVELDRWREASHADADLALELSVERDTLARAIDSRRMAVFLADAARRRAGEVGATIHSLIDATYPGALRDLSLPPPAIQVAGELPDAPAVAIVGSRRASPYGLEIAGWLGSELARAGIVVVSGFARGVDVAAHRGALKAEAGRTLAVLGCGLAHDYPQGQRPLARQIRERGALLTEYPVDEPPQPWHFPVRNRLIAALAQATIVVEAAPRSGSLITARLALELGREVLAVPGRITDELALGTNELLRDGAVPVSHPDDVLEAIGLSELRGSLGTRRPVSRATPRGLAPGQAALYRALDDVDGRAPESLAAVAQLPMDMTLGALLDLELAGHAARLPGGLYVRR